MVATTAWPSILQCSEMEVVQELHFSVTENLPTREQEGAPVAVCVLLLCRCRTSVGQELEYVAALA